MTPSRPSAVGRATRWRAYCAASGRQRVPGGDEGGANRGEHRRHRLDPGLDRAGHAHDTGAGVLLRRPRPHQERPLDDHAQLVHPGPRQRHLGRLRVHARLRSQPGRPHRRARPSLPARRGHRARVVRHDDPVAALRRLPDDVAIITPALITGHSPSARASPPSSSSPPLVDPRLPALCHWVWNVDGGSSSWACSTSPAARWSTSAPASRPSWRRSTWAAGSGPVGALRAPQRDLRGPRRRAPLVRLVRLQRWLGMGRQRDRRQRLPGDQHGRRHGLLTCSSSAGSTRGPVDRRRRLRRRRRASSRSRRRRATST